MASKIPRGAVRRRAATSGAAALPRPRAATATFTKIRLGITPAGMAYSPDRATLYVANSGSGTVSVVDMKARTVKSTINIAGTRPYAIAITPDGKRLYVAEANIGISG